MPSDAERDDTLAAARAEAIAPERATLRRLTAKLRDQPMDPEFAGCLSDDEDDEWDGREEGNAGKRIWSGPELRLLDLLKLRSFRRGHFPLASGGISDYYLDIRATSVSSEGAYLIGEVLFQRTCELPLDALGGLQVGSVPLTTAAVIAYQRRSRLMEGFWVRDAAKDHGTARLIEGNVREGYRVAIIEDVCTKGKSALKAIEAVRAAGCEVVAVVALVDRLEGAEGLLRSHGVRDYRAVFTIRDFGIVPAEAH